MTDTENTQGFFVIEQNGNVTIARFRQSRILTKLDIENFDRELRSLVDELSTRQLILDLNAVQYLTAASLGKLIQMRKKLVAIHGQLILCCMHPDITELFRITRLDQCFTITETLEAALEAMA